MSEIKLENTSEAEVVPTELENSVEDKQQEQSIMASYNVDKSLIKLMAKQETRSSRALTVSFIAIIILLAVAYLIVEVVLEILGYKNLFFSPQLELWSAARLPRVVQSFPLSIVLAVVVCAILVGLFLMYKAFSSGHLAKHVLTSERYALVADDSVLAACMSSKIREYAGLPQGQVRTTISASQITVNVIPVSGRLLNQEDISKYAQQLLDSWQPLKKLRLRVLISGEGVVNK